MKHEGALRVTESRFSISQGFKPSPPLLAYDDMPDWVRTEVFYSIQRVPYTELATTFWADIYHALRPFIRQNIEGRQVPPFRSDHRGTVGLTRFLIEERVEWAIVFDICQAIYRVLFNTHPPHAQELTTDLNRLFAEAGIAWRMNGDDFKRVMDDATEAQIQAAQSLLGEPRFQAPSEQLTLAIKCFIERPEPNLKDSINNAVGSVEGVAKIIAGKPDTGLSDLLNGRPFNDTIHRTLLDALGKIYAYRGAVTGHGQTGIQEAFYDAREAEWVLGMCATSIVYLAKKFPLENGEA